MRKLLAGIGLALTLCIPLPASAQSIHGLVVFQYNSAAHITTSTTTVVKASPGLLVSVCVNTKGASSSTLKVEDALTDTTPIVAVMDTTTAVGCQTFNRAMTVGITIVTATGTPGDYTIVYR